MGYDIPDGAVRIMDELKNNGHEVYLAGGCIRDLLMGHKPHDWDICTSANPEQMKVCFDGYRVLETGLKHGTLTVLVEEEQYEVTTFRGGGHSDLWGDLAHRDFTMNAIAMNREGKLYDPFRGQDDIQSGIIRCVEDPVQRFNEDGLRILRALRFASVLEFRLEESTEAAMHICRENLRQVSPERIMTELKKLMTGKRPGEALKNFHDVLGVFWPEILPCVGFEQKNKYHLFDIWTHTLASVDETDTENWVVRLALLLHDIGKPECFTIDKTGVGHFYGHPEVSAEMASEMLRRLKFDTASQKSIVELVRYHDTVIPVKERNVRRWLNKLGEEQLRKLLFVMWGDAQAHNPELLGDRLDRIRQVENILDDILKRQLCCSIRELAVGGKDVLAAGIPEGNEVGRILNALLNRVLDGELENNREILLDELHRITKWGP